MLRSLTFLSGCLALCWFLLSSAATPRTVDGPLGAPEATARALPVTEVRAAALSSHTADSPAMVGTVRDASDAERDETVDGAGATPALAVPSVGNLAAPIPYVAKRLGLPQSDPRLAFLSDWLADRRSEEHRLTERVSQLGGAAQREAMLAFNAAGDSWRRMLVQQVGYDLASRVVETFCMYRFEPEEGSWHRVDATGARVPFLHEDDDIWQRGESSNPRWEGHW